MVRILTIVLVFAVFSSESKATKIVSSFAERTINITVNEKGFAYIGRDTLTIIEISEELHIRMWKSYLGTGKMPGSVSVKYLGNAASNHQAPMEKALKEAQQKTLQQISVHKYKKKFEELSSSQQKKLKKQFAVLFQQNFTPQ